MATNNDKRNLLTETPSSGFNKDQLTDALNDSKKTRTEALRNATQALQDAFGPKIDQLLKEKVEAPKCSGASWKNLAGAGNVPAETVQTLSFDDLEKMLLDLGIELADDDMVEECRKRLDETKNPDLPASEKDRMYKDIHRKFWAYVQSLPTRNIADNYKPSDTENAVRKFMTDAWQGGIQYISHEGSTIVSALIAVCDCSPAPVSLKQLPDGDRNIINELVYKLVGNRYDTKTFWVKFDDYKNFEFSMETDTQKTKEIKKNEVHFTIGNRVSSIPPAETSRFGNDVKIERKGKDILIGDRIKLEKNKVQAAVQPSHEDHRPASRNGGFTPRQKVAGRNAYEIRQDLIENAIDVIKLSNSTKNSNSDDITDEILNVATRLYEFVENK
jgi:hypothetical protein